jgi:pimeloyl-ACP methyl ester carboxylesterase
MRRRSGLVLVGLILAMGCLLGADEPVPPPAPPTQPRKHLQIEVPPAESAPTSQPSKADEIPRDVLVEMYARELGKTYNPADVDRIHDAHALLESYFIEPTAKARQDVVSKLRDTKLAPSLLGRLARLRMYWPALQPGVYYTNERHGPHDVRYFLGVPKAYDRTKPWPLVIKLPTANAFLTDPMPGPERVTQIYSEWIKAELAQHPDALVLMPLLNLDELYGPSQPGMNTVIQPMLHATGRVNIDPARVYLIGHSMAGHATWNLALHYPTYFAAINPLAGAASGDWQRLRLMNLSNVLPVVWHDASDDVVKVGFSRSLVKVLQDLKIDVDYEETKTAGHAPPPDVLSRTYEKLRARTRELYPKTVNLQSNRPETIFNRADWLQIYQPLVPGKGRRLMLRKGTGPLRTYERAYSARAAITATNRIEIRTDNVATLRLYLNDQMLDLAKPVTVLVNGKTRFEGMATVDVDAMLKDQLFLGRGWRYYTAVIDIDLAPPPTTRPTTTTTRPTPRRKP